MTKMRTRTVLSFNGKYSVFGTFFSVKLQNSSFAEPTIHTSRSPPVSHTKAFDLFQLLRSSRTSVPCLDEHLPGKILSPGYTVVLHGEVRGFWGGPVGWLRWLGGSEEVEGRARKHHDWYIDS